MNIFVTDTCPTISAINLPDILVRKMIVETAQLLSGAHIVLDDNKVAYKLTHKNHPSAKWVRASDSNYRWAFKHLEALCREYQHRFGKVHKTELVALSELESIPKNISKSPLGGFAMAMPDNFKLLGIHDETRAYKAYLLAKFENWQTRTDKKCIVPTWTNRDKPDWVV